VEHATDYPRRKRFVPIGQGQEAFQAAQLRGIKVDFIFPEENHWVLKPKMPKFGKKESSNG
jgi:hypothetical protein